MRGRFRWPRIRLGPLYVNLGKGGRVTSWGFKFGRVTRNVTRGTTSIDTPGPGSVVLGEKKRRGGRR